MIKSEMISFRADSIEQRDIPQYISLIEQVNEVLRHSSSTEHHGNLNNIAASIRQVVLKNDCLEQKNDILDFFFLCEKQMNSGTKKQTKTSIKQSKSWTKIVLKNIRNLKGLHNLYLKMKNIQLKRGFASLNKINQPLKQEDDSISINIDPSSIEVEEDIRLKTLYFFRWCKFIEYGKSIKKLRLKQIDDLRKSLTFNQYAVKFSYFHNWRKISRMSALNKVKFNQIQLIEKKSLFNMTINSFYSLFEIKKIEQKLCQKVKESILICTKQNFFKRFAQNSCSQKSKATKAITLSTILGQRQLRIQKMKYQCLFYMGEIMGSERIKSKTLLSNVEKSEQNYSILCAKSAFFCLKKQIFESRQNTERLNEVRKQIILEEKFGQFMKSKAVEMNQHILINFLKKNKLEKGIRIFNLISILKKKLNNTKIQQGKDLSQSNQSTQSNIEKSLYQCFNDLRMKQQSIKKLAEMRTKNFLNNLKRNSSEQKYLCQKLNELAQHRQSCIFEALKVNKKINSAKASHKIFLKSIYDKNLKKNAFKSFHTFKQMRLSHQGCLQAIQQKIINPKQIQFAFQRICQHKKKIQALIKIFNHLERVKTRFVYEKCFYHHKNVILRTKEMQKTNQLRKLQLLFDFLKKNQQHNRNREEEIRANVVERYTKQRFLNSLRQNYQHEIKKLEFYHFNREQKQVQFVSSLKMKKQESDKQLLRQMRLQRFLGLSLFKTKLEERKKFMETIQEKDLNLQRFLCLNKIEAFMKSLNNQRNQVTLQENQVQQLHVFLTKNKLQYFIQKCAYERKHNTSLINEKIKKISININEVSFYQKFTHESKRNYMNRWIDWKKKSLIFQKLEAHKSIIENQHNLTKALQNFQLSNAWNQIKSNIENERQILLTKQQQLCDFLDHNRRKQINRIITKFSSVRQVQECQHRLKNSIKLKYFSKFMRNSLVTKYQKVKQFCAIRSYARNLKQKSWNGMKMMLMRLRDKQNRIKTEQQLIVKIDKAMYQSRKTNKLAETIQRFNSSMKKGGLGGMVR